jgi:hypothetical protein
MDMKFWNKQNMYFYQNLFFTLVSFATKMKHIYIKK